MIPVHKTGPGCCRSSVQTAGMSSHQIARGATVVRLLERQLLARRFAVQPRAQWTGSPAVTIVDANPGQGESPSLHTAQAGEELPTRKPDRPDWLGAKSGAARQRLASMVSYLPQPLDPGQHPHRRSGSIPQRPPFNTALMRLRPTGPAGTGSLGHAIHGTGIPLGTLFDPRSTPTGQRPCDPVPGRARIAFALLLLTITPKGFLRFGQQPPPHIQALVLPPSPNRLVQTTGSIPGIRGQDHLWDGCHAERSVDRARHRRHDGRCGSQIQTTVP